MARIQDTNGKPVLEDVLTTGSLAVLEAEASVELHGQAVVGIQVSSIGVMTLSFEASVDGINYELVTSMKPEDGTVATATTAAGLWIAPVGGMAFFRVRVSAYTSGTAVVAVKAGQGSSAVLQMFTASGGVTANQGTPNTSANGWPVKITDGVDDALVTGAGALVVDGSAVTQPVSGTVTVNQPVSVDDNAGSLTVDGPLTDAELRATPVPVADGGGSLTVDGPLTDAELRASAVPVSAASLPLPTGASTAALQLADGHNVTVDNVAGTTPVPVEGDAAHDAAVSGNPVRIGAKADTTEPAAVADGDAVDLLADLNGKLVNQPYSVPERSIDGITANMTGTGDVAVIAAPGASLRNYITHILVTNGHDSVGTWVNIKDGATTIYTGYARWRGGGFSLTFPKPLRLTANTALNAANETTASETRVSASGFIAP